MDQVAEQAGIDIAALLADVNPPQREAITYMDGPLLVIAGAGSGKTRVITRRLAYLLARGVRPSQALAITFTNKAAGEMRARVEALVGPNECWVTTFHSFCARLLRREAERLGYGPNYSIYDEDDSIQCVKEALAACNYTDKQWKPAALRHAISAAKNRLQKPEDVDDGSFHGKVVSAVYTAYQETLKASNAMDFDDLLVNVVKLFQTDAEALGRWQERFQHVLIDEYQDTNHAQYLIAKGLTERSRRLCATGDPDQSIYAWRGADITNILDFEEAFPEARVVRLEQNYRSTKTILRAADAMIANNKLRKERRLWTENADGAAIRLLTLGDEKEEADAVVDAVGKSVSAGRRLRDIAMFYRTNAQSRPLEEALMRAGIAYQVVGAIEFYGRKEIKDALAYLRVICNAADMAAFQRVVNVPRRGIGATALAAVVDLAKRKGVTPAAAAASAAEAGVGGKAREALIGFAASMEQFRQGPQSPVADILKKVLHESGYMNSLDPAEDQARIENLDALVAAAAAFDQETQGELAEFMERVSLVTDADDHDPDSERVSLMSLHTAKGLEFPVVFITGIEEGLLPHAMVIGEKSDIGVEEERRLFYVGMTRAKEELILTHAAERFRWGRTEAADPSRFLLEAPGDCFEHQESARVAEKRAMRAAMKQSGVGRGRGHYVPPGQERDDIQYEAEEDWAHSLRNSDQDDAWALEAGDRVRHAKFGTGVVTDIRGYGAGTRISVKFDDARHGEKTLAMSFAKLERMKN
jgi:DNA helicase II / ATP-dependent DNA helicase PcrA